MSKAFFSPPYLVIFFTPGVHFEVALLVPFPRVADVDILEVGEALLDDFAAVLFDEPVPFDTDFAVDADFALVSRVSLPRPSPAFFVAGAFVALEAAFVDPFVAADDADVAFDCFPASFEVLADDAPVELVAAPFLDAVRDEVLLPDPDAAFDDDDFAPLPDDDFPAAFDFAGTAAALTAEPAAPTTAPVAAPATMSAATLFAFSRIVSNVLGFFDFFVAAIIAPLPFRKAGRTSTQSHYIHFAYACMYG